MLDRDGYPPGVPCWIDTEQPDPFAAADFYSGLFGWTFTDRVPAEAPGNYLIAELGGSVVGAVSSPEPDLTPDTPVWNTYVGVDDADAAAARVREAGGDVVAGPLDVGEGAGRYVACRDPEGTPFRMWQPGRRKGVELVNAAGAWNFNTLNSRDPEQARAFYGEVFGWTYSVLDLGSTTTTLWMQPGYGDFLAQSDPEIRERQAGDGAPEGFADAVAWLVDLNQVDGATGVVPFWNITFAVDDTDATVARAVELGATVVSPVTDLGVVRVATLRDPQGAELEVSHYQPDATPG
jgi:predicted enzyme related to lactoylglutathione lyase